MTEIKLPRLHKILVCKLSQDERYQFVPIGLYCNQSLQKAKPGERLQFIEQWRKTTFTLVRKTKLPVNSAIFSFMCHSIYGHGSFDRLAEDWTAICVNEGLGRQAFSDKEVVLVELAPWDKEAYVAEEKARQAHAQALRAAAEREQAMRGAAEERQRFIESIPSQIESNTFNHPDIK